MRAALVAAALLAAAIPAAADEQIPIPGPTISVAPSPSPSPAPRLAEAPCTIEGDEGPNQLTGTPVADVICGHGGDDVIEGLEGDDVLDGGAGADTATWQSAPCCVWADIAEGSASGAMGADQLISIERLTGTAGTDVLRGGPGPNLLDGLGGHDLLWGRDGDDMLLGGDGDDWLAGEGGVNTLDGGAGANVCADAGGTACDPPSPADGKDTRGRLDLSLVNTELGTDPAVWRVRYRGRSSAYRLWDEGYVMVSFDTRGGDEFELHALIRWQKRKVRAFVVDEGARRPSGRLRAKRRGGRGVQVRVPLSRLAIDPARPYYRWAARTVFTGPRCRPCFDTAPGAGAYPQPLV